MMRNIIASIIALSAFFIILPLQAPAKDPVKITIGWEYKDFPLEIMSYEAKGSPRLWETKSVADLSKAPVAKLIEGSSFTLFPGRLKRFVLAVKNTTGKDVYFFSAPHSVTPPEHSLGFKFKCLCVNKAFKIGPGETWYRVVEFRLSPDFDGKELTVSHMILGIDEKRAKSFMNPHTSHDE